MIIIVGVFTFRVEILRHVLYKGTNQKDEKGLKAKYCLPNPIIRTAVQNDLCPCWARTIGPLIMAKDLSARRSERAAGKGFPSEGNLHFPHVEERLGRNVNCIRLS